MHSVDFVIKDDDSEFEQKYPNGLSLSDLVPFYHGVARSDPIKLDWVCHGKLTSLSSGREVACSATASIAPANSVNLSQSKPANSGAPSKLAEFDFDEANQLEVSAAGTQSPASSKTNFRGSAASVSLAGSLPLRRVNGANRSAPKQPRVANMDKILNDFFRTRKETTSAPPPSHSAVEVISSTPSISESEASVCTASAGSGDVVSIVHAAATQPSKEAAVTNQAAVVDIAVAFATTTTTTTNEVSSLPIDHLTVTYNTASEDVNFPPTATVVLTDASRVARDTGDGDVAFEATTTRAGVLSPPSIDGRSYWKSDAHLPMPSTTEAGNSCATDSRDPSKCQVHADHPMDFVVDDSEIRREFASSVINCSPPVNHESVPNLEG